MACSRLKQRDHRRAVGTDPEFFVKALEQLQAWLELPRQLAEDVVLFVSPRESRIRTWLTVVAAQVLISGKEPESIVLNGTAEICREVTVPDALISAGRLASKRDWKPHRLTGQDRRLSVVRRVVEETIAHLLGDDVDERTLDVAVLGRRSNSLDLHLLDELNPRFDRSAAAPRPSQ